MTHPAPMFRTDQFDTSPDIKSISQEASTPGLKPGELPHGRLFTHVPTQGLCLQSATTKEVTAWYLASADMSGDDVAGWRFKPTAGTVEAFPKLAGWTMLIIND